MEAAYLASHVSWNADYVFNVARDDKAADLDGWVTLTNGSGTAFRNAKLQLVAGDLNRVRQALGRMVDAVAAAPMSKDMREMTQESFSEYHLYTLGRKTTINNNETKQVSLLGGTGVPVVKCYVVDGQDFYYHNTYHPGAPIKDVVQVLPVQERREGRARDADAGRHVCGCTRPTRRVGCSSSARIASTIRRRTKR